MSECVVRMEMPKACWSCGLRFVCKAANDFLTTKEAGCSVLKVGMEGCLIVCQLPEGHGRLVSEKDVRWAIDDIVLEIAERIGHVPMTKNETMEYVNRLPTIVPAEAESPSPKPTDPVPVRDVYYVMTECDAKAGTVKYEPRERIEL